MMRMTATVDALPNTTHKRPREDELATLAARASQTRRLENTEYAPQRQTPALPKLSQLLHQSTSSPPPVLRPPHCYQGTDTPTTGRSTLLPSFRVPEGLPSKQLSPKSAMSRKVESDDCSAPSQQEACEEEDKTPWPDAEQYYDLLQNVGRNGIPVYDLGVDPRGVPLHPEDIYSQPKSCMYFLKCSQLLGKGSFGFPRKRRQSAEEANDKKRKLKGRKESSKEFEWRKMSFVTGLPKKQPKVRYVTATCYSRATAVSDKKKVYRMHAVMLADESGTGEDGDHVLVHIRAGGSKRTGVRPFSRSDVSEPLVVAGAHRPVSPPPAAVSSHSAQEQASSASPHNKKLLHVDFGSAAEEAAASSGRHANFDKMQEMVLQNVSTEEDLKRLFANLQNAMKTNTPSRSSGDAQDAY